MFEVHRMTRWRYASSLVHFLLLSVIMTVTWSTVRASDQQDSEPGLEPRAVGVSNRQEESLTRDVEERVKRYSETLQEELEKAYPQTRDKKIPRGFLGLRGKKAPSNFLGIRGRRQDSGSDFSGAKSPYEDSEEEESPFTLKLSTPLEGGSNGVRPIELIKRAPSGFLGMRGKKAPSGFLGMRGKKAPSGFLGMRGKKAPSGFLGMRGKKAPSGFLGLRGKKDMENYEDLEDVLQNLYEQEKRAPRGFLGMRGKKSEDDVTDDDYYSTNQEPLFPNAFSDVIVDVMNEKRAPSRFLGLRG